MQSTTMFIAALFTTAKTWKQPKCPSTDNWLKKMWYTYIIECCSAMKKDEILTLAPIWMDPENIILNEVCQIQKDKYYMILLIYGI